MKAVIVKVYICLTLMIPFILLPSLAQTGRKVAVLYFTDHSNFDRASGCGPLSLGPLNFLFGSGQPRERWDLSSGFRELLNQTLKQEGYNVVEASQVEEVIRKFGMKDLALLGRELDADIMVIGDIRKFEQHRNRLTSQGYTMASGGISGSEHSANVTLLGGVGGFYYTSTVKVDMKIYDESGNELATELVSSKKDLKDFFIGMGPLAKRHRDGDAISNYKSKDRLPIVEYDKLDKMKFGTEEFMNDTLFGLATRDVINKMVAKVGEYIEPVRIPTVRGKIIYVGDGKHLRNNEVYIDLGSSDGILPGHKLGVFTDDLVLTDPDTGKEQRISGKRIGSVKIIKVEANHLSIGEIIEGLDHIEKGNVVRSE